MLRLVTKLVFTAGNVSDFTAAELTAQFPDCVVTGDKWFDIRKHRADLRSRSSSPASPHVAIRSVQSRPMKCSTARHCTENLFQHLKVNRRVPPEE